MPQKEQYKYGKVTFAWEGRPYLSICLNIVLYCDLLSNPERKNALLDIFDEYRSLTGNVFKWSAPPRETDWKQVGTGVDPYNPRNWLLEYKDAPWVIFYHGGEEIEDATDISFFAIESDYPLESKDLRMLSCNFPLAFLNYSTFSLPALMKKWCAKLKPHHGRGGFIVSRSSAYARTDASRLMEADKLLSFSGLQMCHFTEGVYSHKKGGLYDGPRCADWLIALSDMFVDKLGGDEAVKKAMNPLPVIPYDGGLVLQAGDQPKLGGDIRNPQLPDYIKLASVIEPIRAKHVTNMLYKAQKNGEYGVVGAPDFVQEWISRFSVKSK